MPIHPCADGLTKECFRAYPKWARQAFAYKLLHILLPKQLTKNLPRLLSAALIAPGVELPPGVILPPGSVVFPDVSFPPGWTPADLPPTGVIIPPGTIFPPGWTPGDPPPEGVIIPPGTIFPPGWTPGDPPPEGVIIPPDVSPVPPDTGAVPPLYVEPFEPGPIGGSQPASAPAFDIGSLLIDQGTTTTYSKVGDVSYWSDLSMAIKTWLNAEIAAIDIKIGKNNTPTDNVRLEVWACGSEYKPSYILAGGISIAKSAASLPAFALDQDYIRFLFPQKPTLFNDVEYAIVVARSDGYDILNYYKIGRATSPDTPSYYKLPDETWYSYSVGRFNLKIYGFLT